MSIKVVGLKKFATKLGRMKSEILPDVERGVNRATIMVEGRAKMLCPTNKYRAGGELRQSIHPDTQVVKDSVVGKVSTTKEYAAFVEFGVGMAFVEFGVGIKGQMTNRNKKIPLAYRQTPWTYTPDDGETFIRTIGNVAQPYLYPALNQSKQEIKNLIIKSVQGITK